MLVAINEATKWAVSVVTFVVLLLRRDLLSTWCVVGSVAAAFNCKVRFRSSAG